MSLDLDRARETFESSTDFTIGLEEEFAILDPATLELEHRFEDVYAACQDDEVLAESAAGELIASEIEIRSGRAESFAEAVALQRLRRERLFGLVDEMGLALGATGVHPWASYLDQRIIDTPHYNRLRHELGWVAQRNNTWSLHVHMGIQGADRANLIIGSPSEDVGKTESAGQVHQLAAGATGPEANNSRAFSADSAGVRGGSGGFHWFGDGLG